MKKTKICSWLKSSKDFIPDSIKSIVKRRKGASTEYLLTDKLFDLITKELSWNVLFRKKLYSKKNKNKFRNIWIFVAFIYLLMVAISILLYQTFFSFFILTIFFILILPFIIEYLDIIKDKINQLYICGLVGVKYRKNNDDNVFEEELFKYKYRRIHDLLKEDNENIELIDEIIRLFGQKAEQTKFRFNIVAGGLFAIFIVLLSALFSYFLDNNCYSNVLMECWGFWKYSLFIFLCFGILAVVVNRTKSLLNDSMNAKSRKYKKCEEMMRLYKLRTLQKSNNFIR